MTTRDGELEFDWERFVARRGAMILTDPDGFLMDAAPGLDGQASEVVPLSELSQKGVVVLLGMPGAGKSRTLRADFERGSAPGDASPPSRWFDLSEFSTDVRLITHIFRDQSILSSRESNSPFALYLDSLDECQLSVKTVAQIFGSELRTIYWPGLRLRVSCRSAVWPSLLEKALKDVWPKDAVVVVELQPLRRADVVSAANGLGIDSQGLLAEVSRVRAGAFAARPITLKLLLNLYKRSQSLPQRRRDLYARGLRTLVDEHSDSRRALGRAGSLTVQNRLDLAAALSAVSVFCNRTQIWIGAGSQCPEDCLSVDDLADCARHLGLEFDCGIRNAVTEVLDTSLYAGHGESRIAIAHESYREYLGADFLVKRCQNRDQFVSLIVNVHDPDRKVAPQLFGAAAWLYELSPEAREYINAHQPELILQSDVDLDPELPREPLVDAILRLASDWQYIDQDWSSRDRYYKLACEGLPAIVRPYIKGITSSFVARRIAIDIVEACNEQRVLSDLMAVASDPTDAVATREQAAFAISRMNAVPGRACLREFIEHPEETTASDDLIGIALHALWPGEVSSEQLFRSIRTPRQPNHSGAYSQFIGLLLPREIARVELIPALRWLGDSASQQPDFYIAHLQRAILIRALGDCGTVDVRVALANAIWRHLKVHSPIFDQNARSDVPLSIEPQEARRELLLLLARTAKEESAIGIGMVANSRLGILREEDFDFLFSRYDNCQSEADRLLLAQLLSRVVKYLPTESQINVILARCGYEVRERDERLVVVFRWIVEPMWIASPEAEAAREQQRLMKEWERKKEPFKLYPPPSERIRRALEKIESGDLRWFEVLLAELTLEESSVVYGHIGPAIFAQPGWRSAESATRDRIASATLSFIQNYIPKPETSAITNQWKSGDEAPIVALCIIDGYAPDLYERITRENWAGLFTPLMCVPWDEKDERLASWLRKAYEADARAGETLMGVRMRLAVHEQILPDTFRKLAILWNSHLTVSAAEVLKETLSPTYGYVQLLSRLIVHDKEFGLSLAMNILSDRSNEDRRPTTLSLLLTESLADRWDVIWPMVETDDKLAKATFLEQVTSEDSMYTQFCRLSADKLSQIYIRLEQLFPSSEDLPLNGYVTPRHTVGRIREAALSVLRQRGTFEAVSEIIHLSTRYPSSVLIHVSLVDAKQLARAATWQTPMIAEFVELLGDSRKRLVRDSHELSAIVLEAFNRLQRHVQGPNKPASQYWDERVDDQRPKSEIRFADYVRSYLDLVLRSEGVILSREVEIRNLPAAGVGERVDLLVSATSRSLDVAEVVVECKGCWNSGLFEDMESQLRDRYLRGAGHSEGIYLVGWYLCQRWSRDDARRSQAESNIGTMSISDLRTNLGRQALALSGEDCRLASYVLDLSLSRIGASISDT